MTETFEVVTAHFVNVSISNSKSQSTNYCLERRFKKDVTIRDLKNNLELLTGGNANTMKIELYSKEDALIAKLDNDSALLGSYPIDDGMRLHVIDKFELQSQFDDPSQVKKYEIPEEEYAKRTDTVKAFLESNKLGKYNEAELKKKEEEQQREDEENERIANEVEIGSRCEVKVPGIATRRGTVMYAGQTDFKEGWWIGIKYDEPLGKNDGCVGGKRYFECSPKYGGFVKPIYVTVGDFPVDDYDLNEEL